MPTYDYACDKCGQILEVVHGMLDENPQLCPVCSSLLCKVYLTPPMLGKMGNPRTVGHLADKNADQFSQDKKDFLNKEHKRKVKCREPQWYDKHNTKTTEQISTMTKKEIRKYVDTGK